jgi:hypothetical protein
MYRDAFSTEALAFDRCKSYIRYVAAAGITQSGDLVDINA